MNAIPTTLHLGLAALTLASVWYLYLNIENLESDLYSELRSSWISNVIDLTKLKLSSLVIVTSAIGLILAPEHINFFKGLLAITLTFVLVAGSCAINCYFERDLDALMERTKNRPLPTGELSPRFALVFSLILIITGIVGMYFYINPMMAFIGLISMVLYVFVYTPLKTISSISLLVGAIPGALPPVMGWVAVTGKMDAMAWYLFGIVFVWQLPHFLAIAIYHKQDFKVADIKTWVNQLSEQISRYGIAILTLVLVIVSMLPGLTGELSQAYKHSATVLGAAFVILAFLGLYRQSDANYGHIWAKRYFKASVIYLPALLALMIFLR